MKDEQDLIAKVIFTDQFWMSPVIQHRRHTLMREDMRNAIEPFSDGEPISVATAAARYASISLARDEATRITNTPEGLTYGMTISVITGPSFWPHTRDTPVAGHAGVFLVDVETQRVEFWGGKGFHDTPEFTPAIVQAESLVDEGDTAE
jgi:hypothetical protein